MKKQKYKITYKVGDDIKDVIVEAKCIEKILGNISLKNLCISRMIWLSIQCI